MCTSGQAEMLKQTFLQNSELNLRLAIRAKY